jgi:hypothetical protein
MVMDRVQTVSCHYDKLGSKHHVCTSWQLTHRTLFLFQQVCSTNEILVALGL